MKKQLSMLAILVGASLNAQAAQIPFFTIVDVSDKAYASGISTDDNSLIGLNVDSDATDTNNTAEYFSTVQFADFLVDRFRFTLNGYGRESCILSSAVCGSFWDTTKNFAYQWRQDFLLGIDQRQNVGAETTNETNGFVVAMGADSSTYVGYKASPNAVNGTPNSRTAFAVLSSNPASQITLEGTYKVNGVNVLSSANGIKRIDGHILVTGTAATGKNKGVGTDDYNRCYRSDAGENDFIYCPGLDTQASFWMLNDAGNVVGLMQASDYGRGDNSVVQTAAALDVAKYSNTVYGVGYSSTGEVGDNFLSGRNLASYWNLDLNAKTISSTRIIPLPDGEPGKDDAKLQHSWAVAVNDNGYVIGNQRYRINKGQNRPVEMFLFNLSKPGTAASLPLQDKPISGAGSEAAAINEHNMVVGWRDSRHQTQPVVNGTNRMQEAFLLNAAAPANSWYLNDLICGKDDAGNKQCAQNGKYYHIAYASGISSDGTIAATAYRYDSESDLNKRANATVVAVKLTPAVANYDGNTPDKYVVKNAPVNNQTGQDGGEGGGGSLFWLTLLALPFAWLRRYQR
ncbi:DUF3466 family protein [Aeromonas caviae]|uniref:DUF3466 family protein n=1 Tax=Aeromonas caviae TaxID=648 RepID=UPI0021DF8D01|nr:DUF3466 family protein [Aeromonas caviae]MCU9923898.1 DUF3466 family protein [Aeromonas caviae]